MTQLGLVLFLCFAVRAAAFQPRFGSRKILSRLSATSSFLPTTLSADIDDRRGIISEIIKLESTNPTLDPTSSPLFTGTWSLRFSQGYDPSFALPSPTRQLALFLYSGGYSPATFILNALTSQPLASLVSPPPEVTITLSPTQAEATSKLGALGDLTLTSDLTLVSGSCFTETYRDVSGPLSFDFPEAARYSRDLYVTYLDEEVMVVRDGSGVAEVLVRTSSSSNGQAEGGGDGGGDNGGGDWGIMDIDEDVPPVD
ncbi:hypothetical protein TrCOL_g8302 [Triparma columacea]|uniref:Plastid lipid-associated protein/fibrillin conserved domain-containing protein n=1 Tax=Triparma columacea TaxID=722753 RepID=A0A9W7GI96_9STRA|nr:hypothetical protein TrCOL_g8302 [Triparma columacea]